MKKILVLDDNEKLLLRVKENITKFEVIPANTIDAAIEKLKSEKISFIAVDYDLGQDKTGDILYDLLFESGKSIPAMVFSGKDLSEGTKKYLEDKGFSKIISKADVEGSPSKLLEKAAEQILKDCRSRIYQVQKKVEVIGNGGNPLKIGDEVKTIREWIESVAKCNHSEEEEEQIKDLIIQNCLALVKRSGNPEFSKD